MALLLRTNGKRQRIAPNKGKQFTAKELQVLVGGNFAVLKTYINGSVMVVNQHATTANPNASSVAHQTIHGNAVVGTPRELGV